MRFAILFPGQGSQCVGMGADLFDARPDLLGDAADEILGWSLRDVCLKGPEDVLTRTDRAQAALFALGYAAWAELSTCLDVTPVAAAGHSLGEYAALTAAGVFDYRTALRLVSIRGEAMAAAADREPSGMAALIGVDEEEADAISAGRRADGGRMWVANINAPGQIVVAGGRADIDWIVARGRDLGVRRVIPLNVAGAFHSPFMATAASEVATALRDIAVGPFSFPVYANVTGRPYPEGQVADLLERQIVEPVRFAEALVNMNVDAFVHVGPGDVTAGMARKTVKDAAVMVAGDTTSLAAIAERLNEER
ncbi:polyketide biosynthesis malonyl CoA-acyl carrier protein transacylase PksC [bacterium BMS3Abin02]|nr:polyketide biosynthesis malonyl CoA-acyl carrier protein transacylase PksC [bacterium BMS3Abin02]